jgi:hypothetical protein
MTEPVMLRYRIAAIAFGILLLLGGLAKAQDTSDQKIGIPIYDPGSKRYFVLMHAPKPGFWQQAEAEARGLWYKGVRGRLAVVNTFEVHDFLLRTFRSNQYQWIWIGLKYECRARKLVWSDGETFKPGDFEAWAKNWKIDPYFCTDTNFPADWGDVAYSPQHAWVAVGRHKGYEWYFMEYPTGHP